MRQGATCALCSFDLLFLLRYVVELSIPDEVWARAVSLPPPAVIVSEERNVLINPLHPDAGRIAAHKLGKWACDPQLMRSVAGR